MSKILYTDAPSPGEVSWLAFRRDDGTWGVARSNGTAFMTPEGADPLETAELYVSLEGQSPGACLESNVDTTENGGFCDEC